MKKWEKVKDSLDQTYIGRYFAYRRMFEIKGCLKALKQVIGHLINNGSGNYFICTYTN